MDGENIIKIRNPTTVTVQANYSKLSDHIRRLTPNGIQCSVFCGGSNCKYENSENWNANSLAIQGIYSHWITDDILAMARPSTLVIIQKNVIQQFESFGIKSIINLQSSQEHSSCGQPLEASGFSYDPTIFMENSIYYYNFAWKDYGDATLLGLLNMVKVLAFAVSEGRVAIHCHAGLGRTGVLIACYLVYSLRVGANDAIKYVRFKRPGSVQTSGQILCVRHFAQFVLPRTITYCLKENINKDKYMIEFNLQKFLRRQQIMFHGYEARNYKFLPKIVHCLCERILKLCGCWINEFSQLHIPFTSNFLYTKLNKTNIQKYGSSYSLCSTNSDALCLNTDLKSTTEGIFSPISLNLSQNGDLCDSFSEISTLDEEELNEETFIENRCFQGIESQKKFNRKLNNQSLGIQDINVVVRAFLIDFSEVLIDLKKQMRFYQLMINTNDVGWSKLNIETNINLLTILLFEWIEGLRQPVLRIDHFESIVVLYKEPELCFQKFPAENAYLLEYLLRFVSKIQPISKENQNNLIKRMIAACAQQTLSIQGKHLPAGKGLKKLRDGTLACTLQFVQSLFKLVEKHHSVESRIYLEENKLYNETDNNIENCC